MITITISENVSTCFLFKECYWVCVVLRIMRYLSHDHHVYFLRWFFRLEDGGVNTATDRSPPSLQLSAGAAHCWPNVSMYPDTHSRNLLEYIALNRFEGCSKTNILIQSLEIKGAEWLGIYYYFRPFYMLKYQPAHVAASTCSVPASTLWMALPVTSTIFSVGWLIS